MKIEELRQALTFHYQSEGHRLLFPDGSFPYSDKDIELVCGSLVHVRNGTLQVVHLTVKEYVRSCSGPDSSRLLIEAESASSRLAVVCLSFLGSHCTQPITNFDTSEIDLHQLRNNVPFIEYAATFWMFHLTHSEAKDSLEVSKQFRKTFNSPSTFCWMETYLALQPSNLPDMSIFLDAIRNWVIKLEKNCYPAQGSSISFMTDWCEAMKQTLSEYGGTLVLRPFEIHSLSLDFAFSNGELGELYEKFGNVNQREKSSRFEIHQHLDQPSTVTEVPPNRRLQGDFTGLACGAGLFLHDSRRDVYIWSPMSFGSNDMILWVQSPSDGKRLRPVKCQVDFDAASTVYIGDVLGYDLSHDGLLLLIVLSLSERRLGYKSHLTLIWQIEEQLDFSKGLNAAPWACLRFRCASEYNEYAWVYMGCTAFRSDGGFCTPAGLINSTLNQVSPTSADILKLFDPDHDQTKALYSGNGEFLFIAKAGVAERRIIKKLALPSMEKVGEFQLDMEAVEINSNPNPLSNPQFDIWKVSPSGRYLVFSFKYAFPEGGHSILLDTISGETVEIEGYPPDITYAGLLHHFSHDEREIKILYPSFQDSTTIMLNYAGLPSNLFLKSRKVFPDLYGSDHYGTKWYVSHDHTLAIIAASSGVIERINLDDKVDRVYELRIINNNLNKIDRIYTFLSQDSHRLAHVRLRKGKGCLEVLEIANTAKKSRHLELHEPETDTEVVTMSPDLSILVTGTKLYNLALLDDQIASISRPFRIVNFSIDQYTKCVVSSSNTFIAYIQNCWISIFRLDVEGTSWVPIPALLPQYITELSVQFHPSLPLMAAIYQTQPNYLSYRHKLNVSRKDRQSSSQILPPFHVAIMDLETENIRHVDMLGDVPLPLVERLESSNVDIFYCVKELTFRQSF